MQIATVQTCRGSHTHTIVTSPSDKDNIYVYVSGTAGIRSAAELAGCSGGSSTADPNTANFRIDVIKVPVAAPQTAADRQPPAPVQQVRLERVRGRLRHHRAAP